MNNTNLLYLPKFVLLFFVILVFDSCRSQKDISPVSEALRRSPKSLVSSMHSNHAEFEYFSSRFSGNALIENQNYNVAGSIRIHKDQAIYISIAPILGIEVARMLITPDTVKIINRIESSYFVGDMQFLNKMLNTDLDFYMLQAILTGNDFTHFNTNNFEVLEDRGRLMLHSPSRGRQTTGPSGQLYQHNLWLNESSYKIEQTVLYEPQGQRTIKAAYSAFASIGQQTLPSQINIEFTEPSAKAEFSIRYNRTDLDNPQQMSFSIPERYVPMDF